MYRMSGALEIFFGNVLYKCSFYLLTYLLTYDDNVRYVGLP